MKLQYSLFGVFLVVLPFLQSPACSGMEMAVLDSKFTTHNQRIHNARERLRRDNELVRSHDVNRVQAEIDKEPHKFDLRITKSALLIAQGDADGGILAAQQAAAVPEYGSYDAETRQQIAIARITQVRDSYGRNTAEYGRANRYYCENAKHYNETLLTTGAAQRYDLAGC
jgi:hypothetical protein